MAQFDLLIVEDHPLFQSGMAHMAAALRPGWRLRFAGNAASALSALGSATPDIVVLDVGLPDDDGFALARTIAAEPAAPPILLISARDTPVMATLAARHGARGFIGKGAAPAAIVEAIDRVLTGGEAFSTPMPGTEIPTLTPRQVQVLALLEQGCSNKEMRYRLGIAERTVRAHLTEVFTVLRVNSRTQALMRARELGLIR